MKIDRLCILGVGLIGGSLARALKRVDYCQSVVGWGRNRENLLTAVNLGVIDEYETDLTAAVAGADVVVIATPLSTNAEIFRAIAASVGSDTVLTDVGSAKGCIVDAARQNLGTHFSAFVPGHPIAGKEKSGVTASTADLFANHVVILTPVEETGVHALSTITAMWEAALAEVITLDVMHHDAVLAATSHLPHVLAYALVDCLSRMQEREEIFQFAAGGFIDFTRIASSNPAMWHDICFSNRDSLLRALDDYDVHLKAVRSAIEDGDSEALLEIFTRAKAARDGMLRDREVPGAG